MCSVRVCLQILIIDKACLRKIVLLTILLHRDLQTSFFGKYFYIDVISINEMHMYVVSE